MQLNTKSAYQFDLDGFLVGKVNAIESPKEPGNYVLPNGARFLEPPPDFNTNECLFHDGIVWMIKPDFSGKPYYHRKDRSVKYFVKGEELDGNYTSIEPLQNERFQKFTSTWVIDEDAKAENQKSILRSVRNSLLLETDKYILPDYPLDASIKEKYLEYRQYLRSYTETDNWHLSDPISFEAWKSNK
ncbi:phage tail assembly chaperone [Leptospira sp. 'Mane']|uniref:phage tail assembly chaperone n=1 Tax=Leptospira sp. 'Mane' TaxID=3387407 RepID=UPI00398B5971